MNDISKSKQGFTLIELLVVIAIIGLLAAVVMASLNSAREKGRDARRAADMKQIQNALELYYADNDRYPPETWCDSSRGSQNSACPASGSNWNTGSAFYTALVPQYIPQLPVDPINDTTYYYRYEPNTPKDYCIHATLEGGGAINLHNGAGAPTSC